MVLRGYTTEAEYQMLRSEMLLESGEDAFFSGDLSITWPDVKARLDGLPAE